MHIYQAIILGIVEGLTEFLPISSTAHLLLTQKILGIVSTDFVKTFSIAIQLGAIGAVIIFYSTKLRLIKEIWLKVIVAFIPTGIVGFVLYKSIRHLLEGNDQIILWALGLGGIVLVLFEFFSKNKISQVEVVQELRSFSYPRAFLVGLAQSLAVVPGVSRSAATIVAGRALGLSRQAVVEFSFLLAIPTIGAATLYDLYKNASAFSTGQYDILIIGFISAFISAYIGIRWMIRFIKEHNFIWFGYYRIVLALAWFPFF